MDHEDGQDQDQTAREWLAALKEYEVQLRRRSARWLWWMLSAGPLAAISFVLGDRSLLAAGAVVLVGMIIALYAGVRVWLLRMCQHSVKTPQSFTYYADLLTSSELAPRLLRGEVTGNEIVAYLPQYWKRLLSILPAGNKVRIINRLVYTLDWHLGPPREYTTSFHTFHILLIFPVLIILFGLLLKSTALIIAGIAVVLLIESTIIFTIIQNSVQLSRYLRQSWTKILQPADAVQAVSPQSTRPLTPEVAASTRQTLLIINQLKQDLIQHRIMLFKYPVLLITPAFIPLSSPGYMWAFLVVLMGFTLLPFAAPHPLLKSYRRAIQEKLEHSTLALRLATRECTMEQLKEFVPTWLHYFLAFPRCPRGYGDDLRQQVWRVAFNLDWYLGAPRPLLRLHWITLILQAIVALVAFLRPVYRLTFNVSPVTQASWKVISPADIITMLAALALAVPSIVYGVRASVWADELLAYLRSRAQAVDEQPTS